jgi:hypothetical protein
MPWEWSPLGQSIRGYYRFPWILLFDPEIEEDIHWFKIFIHFYFTVKGIRIRPRKPLPCQHNMNKDKKSNRLLSPVTCSEKVSHILEGMRRVQILF